MPSLNVYPSAYQTEIDSLTKRSKTSDNVFLHVYKVLAEAPDPYPLLEAAVVRVLSPILSAIPQPTSLCLGPGS